MKKGNISIFIPHLGCPQQCSFCNQKTITGKSEQPTPSDVENAVKKALAKKVPAVCTIGFKYKFFVWLSRILPQRVVTKIVNKMYAK